MMIFDGGQALKRLKQAVKRLKPFYSNTLVSIR